MESELEGWQDSRRESGTEKLINFTADQCDKLTGHKIFINLNSKISYMSPYFFNKWKGVNKDIQTVIHGNKILASIKIGGRIYPIFF